MIEGNLKRYLKLGALAFLLIALLGPYFGVHLVSASAHRASLETEPDLALPLHNPVPIPEGLKPLAHDRSAAVEVPAGKLSEIEDLLGSNSGAQQAGNSNGQN